MAKKRKIAPPKDRRKKTRQVHVLNDRSTPRDVELARSDLRNFFLEGAEKHHGGW